MMFPTLSLSLCAANGVIVFVAMGNSGDLYGTVNSPADEKFVVGVGSHDYYFDVSTYQARGMTLAERPFGYVTKNSSPLS